MQLFSFWTLPIVLFLLKTLSSLDWNLSMSLGKSLLS
jgi:hypothetical protein